MSYPDIRLIGSKTGCKVYYYEETRSTNDLAKAAAESGAPDGTLFIAKNQTSGHGRSGKSFFCYDGGLYISLIIRGASLPAELITSASAAAVSRAIRAASGVQTEIKWVNDLYVNDKKVCGILALHAGGAYVVGIGINVREVSFPDDLRRTAAALGSGIDLDILVSKIVIQLRRAVCESADTVVDYCRKHSYTLGKRVAYIKNDIAYNGLAGSLNPDGSLTVIFDDGSKEILTSGEISVKPEKL